MLNHKSEDNKKSIMHGPDGWAKLNHLLTAIYIILFIAIILLLNAVLSIHIPTAESNEAMTVSYYKYIILSIVTGLVTASIVYRKMFVDAMRRSSIEIQNKKEEAEEAVKRMSSVVDNVLDAIITISDVGEVESFNRAAEKIFGYKAEEVIGKNVKMLMPDPYHSEHDGYLKNYLQTHDAKVIGIGREVKAKRKDNSIFPITLGVNEVEVSGRRLFVGIIRDISDEKESQRKMEEYNHKLEEAWSKAEKANQAKSEFLATMSHEIRTPMNGIIGVSELLSYTDLEQQQEKYVNTIQASGELLLSLINDILDFSKIEAGELELESIPIVLNGLAEEVVHLLNTKAHENNVEIVVRIPQDVPLAVKSDPVRLRQILINLIGNAIKFTKDGYVLLSIEKISKENGQVRLKFSISDTGVGIPEDKILTIFEHFCQADTSTTRQYGGSGLGLAICRKLIKIMGGEIRVKSVVGKGSTFLFELDFPISQDYTEVNLSTVKTLKDKRILIVDDCQANLAVFSEYLSHIGIKSETELTVDGMFSKMENSNGNGTPFDVVIIDYYMPSINGIDAAKEIKNHNNKYGNADIILLTSLDIKPDDKNLEALGIFSSLSKPVYPVTLINNLIEVFSSKKHNRQKSKNNKKEVQKNIVKKG